MNPEICEMFDLIKEHDELDCPLNPCPFRKAAVDTINKISAILDPQIPEKYASMSCDEILGGIGQYEIS